MPAVLGVDYGTVRVGVAVAVDGQAPERVAALPNDPKLIANIAGAAQTYGADTVVVGLPRNLDGDDTPQTALTREFAKRLEAETGLRVVLQDEAGSSQEALERLRYRKVPTGQVQRLLDAEAAVIILEDYNK